MIQHEELLEHDRIMEEAYLCHLLMSEPDTFAKVMMESRVPSAAMLADLASQLPRMVKPSKLLRPVEFQELFFRDEEQAYAWLELIPDHDAKGFLKALGDYIVQEGVQFML